MDSAVLDINDASEMPNSVDPDIRAALIWGCMVSQTCLSQQLEFLWCSDSRIM